MEISLKSEGISLFLECVEVGENDPHSIRFKVEIELEHPTGSFTYSADDIWLDTDMWDCFEHRLNKGLEQKAIFHDQSNYFEISLERNSRNIEFLLKVREPLIKRGEASISSSQKVELDNSFINSIKHGFHEFPKFW